jgi:hypothetical protein
VYPGTLFSEFAYSRCARQMTSWCDLASSCTPAAAAAPSSYFPGDGGESVAPPPRGRRADRLLGAPAGGAPLVRLTLRAFPASWRLKEALALPWAAVLTPWTRALWRNDAASGVDAARHAMRAREVRAADIARCPACGGLINATCVVQRRAWQCSLCGEWNPLEGERYTAAGGSGRGTHPELQRAWGEFFVARGAPRQGIIAHVIAVDVTRQAARGGYLEAVRRGLCRAVESLPENTWVALLGVDARRISVCDLAASTGAPHVLRTAVVQPPKSGGSGGAVLVPLVDLLQTRQLAVRVGDHREAILNTINALCGGTGDNNDNNNNNNNNNDNVDDRDGAAIQAALTALLEYLARPTPDPANARLGDPSLNQTIVAARISIVALSRSSDSGVAAAPLPADLVQFAAMSGVCVDVYAPDADLPRSCAATVFAAIVCKSGGRFRACLSPQCLENDVARHVGAAYAAAGMLSVRTSGGYSALTEESGLAGLGTGMVARAEAEGSSSFHGEAGQGMQFHGLHLAGCDASTSVALSFKTDNSGLAVQPFLTSSDLNRPVLQICYEFFQQENDCVVRRLRVMTMLIPVARNVHSLMLHADPSAVFLVACRKILSSRAAACGGGGGGGGGGGSRVGGDRGVGGEAAADPAEDVAGLLADWLVYLVKQYQVHVVREMSDGGGAVGTSPAAVDVFTNAKDGQRLAPLVQLVYGLLRSKALGGNNEGTDSERAVALRIMLAGLSCPELERAVYPRVVVYDSAARLVQTVEVPHNVGMGEGGLRPLTAAPYETLWKSGSTIIVDAFFTLTAFVGSEGIRGVSRDGETAAAAAAAAAEEVVLDPDSMLAAQLERRGETAAQCPDIRWKLSGNVAVFRTMFVDDNSTKMFGGSGRGGGGGKEEMMTFSRFVARVRHEVCESLG